MPCKDYAPGFSTARIDILIGDSVGDKSLPVSYYKGVAKAANYEYDCTKMDCPFTTLDSYRRRSAGSYTYYTTVGTGG